MKGVKLKRKELKDRLKDNILDLSLSDLQEIPVREMEHIREATNVNLSNNMLTSLPKNFVNLKQILVLDLSKNMLTELPENFGEMTQLRHLDLYANQISRLPLSLCELKNLRWLDLKENPLTPTVASIAGQCSNLKECQECARNIVHYLSRIKVMLEERSRDAAAEVQAQSNVSKPTENKEKKKKKKKGDKGANEMKKTNENRTSSRTQDKISESNNNNLRVRTLPSDNTCIRKLHRSSGIKFSSTWLIVWFFVLSSLLIVALVVLSWYYEEQVDVILQNAQKFSGLPLKDYYKHAINWLQHIAKIANVQIDYFINKLYDYYNLEIFRNKDNVNEEL